VIIAGKILTEKKVLKFTRLENYQQGIVRQNVFYPLTKKQPDYYEK